MFNLFSLFYLVHPNACAVRSLLIHGSCFSQWSAGKCYKCFMCSIQNLIIIIIIIMWLFPPHTWHLSRICRSKDIVMHALHPIICVCNDLCLCLQFMDRLKLLLMPAKHQPDLVYLRHVPLRKVHLFTFIQILCLALLWILKSTVAAIIFPVMVRDIRILRLDQ